MVVDGLHLLEIIQQPQYLRPKRSQCRLATNSLELQTSLHIPGTLLLHSDSIENRSEAPSVEVILERRIGPPRE
jgi:hypothetical protein